MSDDQDIADLVSEALAVDVTSAVRLSGGASRQTWKVEAGGDARIVQRQRVGDPRTVEREVSVLRAALAAGAPVPVVVAHGEDHGGRGYLVAEVVDGETIARRILRDEALAGARTHLVRQLGAALAAIHSIAVEDVEGLDYPDPLRRLRDTFDSMHEAHPAFELAFAWLEDRRPEPAPAVVVHGDFRLGNIVVGPEGLRAVLDWELVHLGDPMEDLGWLGVRAWRFGSQRQVAGLGDDAELFDAYQQAGGGPIEKDRVRWWRVFGTLQWGVMCMIQARIHLSGITRSHELAAIGRRVCENEYDVLVEMGLQTPAVPALASDPASGVHDAPSASQLLEAVREFLLDQLAPTLDGRLRFHSKVAANVLSMVEREIGLGRPMEQRHRERLDQIGVADESELAAMIRSGSAGVDDDRVLGAVWGSVIDKLLVANPGHLDPPTH